MKGVRLFLVLGIVVVAFAFLIFAYDPAAPRPNAPPANEVVSADADSPGDLVVGQPIVLGNLTIFPVSSKTPREEDRFITLDEGLQSGTVEIHEKGAGRTADRANPRDNDDPFAPAAPEPVGQANAANPTAINDPFAEPAGQAGVANPPAADDPFAGNEVNQLLVVNRSERPLYLMPGEIIIGGDQDRTIGRELVIAADGKPVAIDVFCVEHGRWGSREQGEYAPLIAAAMPQRPFVTSVVPVSDFDALEALVVTNLGSVEETTAAANSGKFIGSLGSLNKSARLAVQQGDGQGTVWDEVARQNAKAGVETESGTFASNYSDAGARERLDPYLKHFKQPIEESKNIVGVIVAVNGKVESMDVFESTPLFRKLWPKLLKSYALDAASAMQSGSDQNIATRAAAIAFFQEVAKAQATESETSGDLALSQGESDRVLLFSAHERRVMEQVDGAASFGGGMGGFGGGMMGGMGGAIHSSGFSK